MEDAILADAPGAAIGQCEAGTAAPEPARPIHKVSTVYSAEFKAQAVSDFLKVRDRTTRAEFARSRGIPPGTFDGWYWKAMGLKRGHAKEPSVSKSIKFCSFWSVEFVGPPKRRAGLFSSASPSFSHCNPLGDSRHPVRRPPPSSPLCGRTCRLS